MAWVKLITREVPYFQVYCAAVGQTGGMRSAIGVGLSKVLYVSRRGLETSYRDDSDLARFASSVGEKTAENQAFVPAVCKKLEAAAAALEAECSRLGSSGLETLSLEGLSKEFSGIYGKYQAVWDLFLFPALADKALPEAAATYGGELSRARDYSSNVVMNLAEGRALPRLFGAIAKRAGVGVDLGFARPEEISSLLAGKGIDGALAEARFEHYALLVDGGEPVEFIGGGAEALEARELPAEVELPSEVRGATANSGRAVGRVRVVSRKADLAQLKKGEVVVAPMTTVDFVPFLKAAAAIVTDEGGITCHAAVISRELGIPCVVGTKIATRALKDGDLVEVDATHGTVRKL